MTSRFDLVTIDTRRPDELSLFWAAALGLVEIEREDGDRWVVLADRDGTRRLGFQRGEHSPGCIHLDVVCEPGDFIDEIERLRRVGAQPVAVPRQEPYGMIAMFRDPDGNIFDLCAYE